MISLDVRNSYALRRAADAPGSVGQTQRRYTHLQVDDVRDEMLNIAQMENNIETIYNFSLFSYYTL